MKGKTFRLLGILFTSARRLQKRNCNLVKRLKSVLLKLNKLVCNSNCHLKPLYIQLKKLNRQTRQLVIILTLKLQNLLFSFIFFPKFNLYSLSFDKYIYNSQNNSMIYNINWMDCTMLKKNKANARFQDPTLSALFSYFGAVFDSQSPFFTDRYHYLGDPFNHQLQLCLLLRMPGSSKMAKKFSHFLRSVVIAAVHLVYIYIVGNLT